MTGSALYLGLAVHRGWLFALTLPLGLMSLVVTAWGGGSRGRARRLFASDPRLADPRSAEWDERGLRLSSPTWEHDIPWEAVAGLGELRGIFVVYDPDLGHVVPKRALAGPEGEEQLRRAFRDHAPDALL